jgi:ABC-type oligopeptide transport system ATPase subunit
VFRKKVDVLKAVDDVSFDIMPGETLGIVGESGSGKTTCARAILRALRPTAGSVIFSNDGRTVDLCTIPERKLKPLRQEMQMIFQDPFSSLNPRMTVGEIVGEPLVVHGISNRRERSDRVIEMLERVGLQADHVHRYPHAFSGGQRQRIGIARALILRPSFVVCDEAVSALDVSVQAQVIRLLMDLQKEFKLTYIFVSHDLGVVRQISNRVAVMFKGRLMEVAPTEEIFSNPRHPYTRVLLSAIPYPDPDRKLQPLRVQDLTPEELEPLQELR